MKKVFFKTFGCRTNVFDSQVMMSRLDGYEVTQDEGKADVIVVNSCTVTNGADSSVRGYINYANKFGDVKILLTGCGAHTKGESLFKDEKIFGVFGQSEKEKINTLLEAPRPFYELGDLDFIDDNIVDDFVGKSRAFIKIQEGCDFRCSYCIIPFVRGDARSMDEENILEQIRNLAANGFGEFVLTGTNVGSYGKGSGTSMATLLKKISYIRGVRRIRLGSIEPIQIDDEFKEILGESWIEKHLHIALQHTSKEMLRIMNRRNKFESDIVLFNELAEKGFALGTDFIVGHPGETDALWDEAMQNLKMLPLTHIHAFTYSKRDLTPSAQLEQSVNGNVSKERMAELTATVNSKNLEFRTRQTTPLDVLIESKKDGFYYGLDQYFNKIHVNSDEDLVGNWLSIENYIVKEESNYAEF
ncbi:MAG: tRNA (N(6)-L-threonylcarbamoyladenosine(37)-C(2))-methylthiotransferase MtaB [Campylobacterota bacterium]|nr:tRNA (N(6)-L-threonylcarbamoyladenosine(37)-C(2))-methylthiotransferase MtaB [Campylobacterota bacterium]